MKLNIPPLSPEDIAEKVAEVKRLDGEDSTLFLPPVDILHIVEILYQMDVIPFPGLLEKFRVDAMLMCDFSGLYIDTAEYNSLEDPERKNNRRLRMTLAHELGHLVLHRKYVEPYVESLETIDEYKNMALRHYKYLGYAEWQAMEFAGQLMVPEDVLTVVFNQMYPSAIDGHDLTNPTDHEATRSELCREIGYKFDVNEGVVSRRLDILGLWPIE